MEKEEQIKRIEKFLDEVVIQELGKAHQAGLTYMQFVLMGQAIEVLGSLLDNKPIKVKDQSAKRFSNSINWLFGGRYRLLNTNNVLYDKLRNQMTHTFIPSNDILLRNQKDNQGEYHHLEFWNGKLVLVSEVFYEDICRACRRLLHLLKEGKVKPKNIAFEIYEK